MCNVVTSHRLLVWVETDSVQFVFFPLSIISANVLSLRTNYRALRSTRKTEDTNEQANASERAH